MFSFFHIEQSPTWDTNIVLAYDCTTFERLLNRSSFPQTYFSGRLIKLKLIHTLYCPKE